MTHSSQRTLQPHESGFWELNCDEKDATQTSWDWDASDRTLNPWHRTTSTTLFQWRLQYLSAVRGFPKVHDRVAG